MPRWCISSLRKGVSQDSGKDEMVFGYGVGTSNFITLKSSPDGSKALINVIYGWRSSTLYLGDLMRPNT